MRLILGFFFGGVSALGVLCAQDNPAGQKAPEVFLQILNGIAPDPVDIEVDGKILFPSVGPGQRLSAFGLPTNKTKLVLIDKKSGQRKTIPVELDAGQYTLITAGDFQVLPGSENAGEAESEVRVFASIFSNGPTKGESSVRVRLVNGLVDEPLQIKGPGGKAWTIDPMKVEVVAGLPEKLLLEAVGPNGKRNLYLSQQAPVKNIAVVFFPSGKSFAFRAMTEFTPEGAAADRRKAEETEKREEEEAAKLRQ